MVEKDKVRNPDQLTLGEDIAIQLLRTSELRATKKASRKPIVEIEDAPLDTFARLQPQVFSDEYTVRYVRFSGEILLLSYPRKRVKEIPGQKRLSTRVKIEGRPHKNWVRHRDIETVIRKANHILEKAPDTKINIQNVLELTRNLFFKFHQGEITREELSIHFEEVYKLLKEVGLLRVRVPQKKLAVDQILKAMNLDKIDRFNPQASKLRLASSSIKQTVELIGLGKATSKYDRLLLLLLLEREYERFCINQVIERW